MYNRDISHLEVTMTFLMRPKKCKSFYFLQPKIVPPYQKLYGWSLYQPTILVFNNNKCA